MNGETRLRVGRWVFVYLFSFFLNEKRMVCRLVRGWAPVGEMIVRRVGVQFQPAMCAIFIAQGAYRGKFDFTFMKVDWPLWTMISIEAVVH